MDFFFDGIRIGSQQVLGANFEMLFKHIILDWKEDRRVTEEQKATPVSVYLTRSYDGCPPASHRLSHGVSG